LAIDSTDIIDCLNSLHVSVNDLQVLPEGWYFANTFFGCILSSVYDITCSRVTPSSFKAIICSFLILKQNIPAFDSFAKRMFDARTGLT
jgi:hypothetical protein